MTTATTSARGLAGAASRAASHVIDPVPRITEPEPTRGPGPSHSPPDTRYVPGNRLARGLGWFSVGLGLAEVLAPRALARLTGVHNQGLLQLYGLREIACGLDILATNRPVGGLWARVAGDALDLATLAGADDPGAARTAALAVLGVTALDVVCALQLSAAAAAEG
jgi:hypothetical protein